MANSSTPELHEAPLFNWLTQRSAGLLLHPTSLPGDQGIGTFEPEPAIRFLDFLSASGFSQWQVCPLGPTGYGDSPYQCFSAFAGNPYLIDLKALVKAGLLENQDLEGMRALPQDHADYGGLWVRKWPLLFKAHERFAKGKTRLSYGDFKDFQKKQASWLTPYATFRALKDHFKGAPWWQWPKELRDFKTAPKSPVVKQLASQIEAHAFFQYLFFGQWAELRSLAKARGIEIVGDIPIFVARDSADLWSRPELFELDPATAAPLAVAGVPPDYFSADGQLWGNPLYKWEVHQQESFTWWCERLEAAFAMADIVRIDHFRAFDEYWRIPADAKTARSGKWLKGPGLDFFRAVKARFPQARIIAEDLGDIGPSVRELRDRAGLPGMAILQFAFGGDASNLYLPHNQTACTVVYPGTHDNDTTLGWYASAGEKARDHLRRYLRVSGDEAGWDLLRSAYGCVARMAVVPMQDLLSLGSKARLNAPGLAEGNWQWRYRQAELDKLAGQTAAYLHQLAELTGRLPAARK